MAVKLIFVSLRNQSNTTLKKNSGLGLGLGLGLGCMYVCAGLPAR